MKVFYSPYTLTPLKSANRLSSLKPKAGVYIKGMLKDKVLFADYFPHLPLGDRSVDEFLQDFKFQDHEYDRKVFHLLLKDESFQKGRSEYFKNHQLWTGVEDLQSPVVKYKLQGREDRKFLKALKEGLTLRLDANGLFTKQDYLEFLKDIPQSQREKIEYIEDPLSDIDWSGLTIPGARDFIKGTPFSTYIYKPNCEFKPKEEVKIIYSSYMGSDLGRWHAYSELLNDGDLSLTHGILTSGYYREEKNLFIGSFSEGFTTRAESVSEVYKDVSNSPWKLLCSI